MLDRETIKSNIKSWPAFLSLMRILKKEDSRGDRKLIASIITGDPDSDYLIEADFNTKTIVIYSEYIRDRYERALFFKLSDISPEN